MITYADILAHHFADDEWSINGNDYQSLEWLSNSPKPTKDQLDALADQTEKTIAIEHAQKLRRNAYRNEADPLFFGWQRGENTEQDWLDKVAEIRARYPYPA